MNAALSGHFTGVYYFREKHVKFHTTMAVWAMFYTKRKLGLDASMIVERINTFFGDEVICYGAI